MLEILGEVDRRHATLAQLPLEAVTFGEALVRRGGGRWDRGITYILVRRAAREAH